MDSSLKRFIAAIVVSVQILAPIQPLLAEEPAPVLSVDSIMRAAQADWDNLYKFWFDDARGPDPTGYFGPGNFHGLFNFTLDWVLHDLSTLEKRQEKDPDAVDTRANYGLPLPGTTHDLKKVHALEYWFNLCMLQGLFLTGDRVTEREFIDMRSRHFGDMDGFIKELTEYVQRPDVAKKGPMYGIMAKAKEYALLLENKKPGSGIQWLSTDGSPFWQVMNRIWLLGIGSYPLSVAGCSINASQSCSIDSHCPSGEVCNSAGYQLGNACMAAMSNILITNYTYGPYTAFKLNQIKPFPMELAPVSEYAKIIGKGEDKPCVSSAEGIKCQPAMRAFWVGIPGDDQCGSAPEAGDICPGDVGSGQKIYNSIIQIFIDLTEYEIRLQQLIDDLKNEGQTAAPDAAAAARDAATKGSALALSLPLSDISASSVIGRVVANLLGIVGSIALLMFVYGGITWLTASGNDKRIAQAKAIMTWAALGVVAIFMAYAVISVVVGTIKA